MAVVWTSSSIRLAENDSLTHYVHWRERRLLTAGFTGGQIPEAKTNRLLLTNLLTSGDLNPMIDDIAAALRTIDERCAAGKVVVQIG